MSFQAYFQLIFIVLIGYLSGQLKLYKDLGNAIDILNRFSLYIGFPILIFQSLINKEYTLPSGFYFYFAHITSILLTLVILYLTAISIGKKFKPILGSLAIGSIFGNIAYLGIPICAQIVEKKELGIVSLSAAIYLVIALSLGQLLLITWSNNKEKSYKDIFNTIIKQPLLWAPILGMLFRFFPETYTNFISIPFNPIATSSGTISLYMLGLYLYANKNQLVIPKAGTFVLLLFKMLILPIIFSITSIIGYKMNLLTLVELKIMMLQATMPVAITTFSLTYKYEGGVEIVAQAIVMSTILSLLLLPIVVSYLFL